MQVYRGRDLHFQLFRMRPSLSAPGFERATRQWDLNPESDGLVGEGCDPCGRVRSGEVAREQEHDQRRAEAWQEEATQAEPVAASRVFGHSHPIGPMNPLNIVMVFIAAMPAAAARPAKNCVGTASAGPCIDMKATKLNPNEATMSQGMCA